VSEDFEIPAPVYRVPRPRGVLDGGTGRLVLIAAGLGGTLLVVLGLSLVGGHHRGAIPVIEAEAGPVRVKPDNPGGMSIAGSEDEVLSSDDSGKLAPAAEAPALQALREQEQAETSHAAVASPTAPAPVAAAPAPVAAPAAATPVAAPPVPAAHPAVLAAAHPAEVRPAHGTDVQLGAVDSEAAAQQEWARLSRKAPELLGSRRPAFSPAERGGQTFWRLRTGGFASVAEATTFCERARAKHLPCDIAAF
jgi:hypothetical protein